jgi:hypothetical protein
LALTRVCPNPDGNEEPVSTVKTRPTGGYAATNSDLSTPSSTGRLLSNRNAVPLPKEEILLVDEVDVFFGSDFYGQTYNQVTQIREPEVRQILELIWSSFKQGGRRLHLSDIKKTAEYMSLVVKMKPFATVVDNEISLMLDAVRRVDDEPYFLDSKDRIGYKVLDTVSYTVTMGYRTVFAYLKEYDRGKLRFHVVNFPTRTSVRPGSLGYPVPLPLWALTRSRFSRNMASQDSCSCQVCMDNQISNSTQSVMVFVSKPARVTCTIGSRKKFHEQHRQIVR